MHCSIAYLTLFFTRIAEQFTLSRKIKVSIHTCISMYIVHNAYTYVNPNHHNGSNIHYNIVTQKGQ